MDATLAKKDFSEKTKKVYVSIIKRLVKLGFKFPKSKSEKVDYIKQFFSDNKLEKASTRLDLLNLVIVLRTIEELPTEKLKAYRGELGKERLTNQVGKMADLKDKLMQLVLVLELVLPIASVMLCLHELYLSIHQTTLQEPQEECFQSKIHSYFQ